MTTYEDIAFDFVSSTSGSFDMLLGRLKLSREDATVAALNFYALYIHGQHMGGRQLMMMEPTGKNGWIMDDSRTKQHVRAGIESLEVDIEILERMTRHARKADPADTLTSAFIMLEKICDVRDSGGMVGLYDERADDVELLSLDFQMVEATPEVIDRFILAMVPARMSMN